MTRSCHVQHRENQNLATKRRVGCPQGGAIVNLLSPASRLGAPGEYVDYAAFKAATDTLTIGLSKEVAGYYDRLTTFLDHTVAEQFVKPAHRATLIGGDADQVAVDVIALRGAAALEQGALSCQS